MSGSGVTVTVTADEHAGMLRVARERGVKARLEGYQRRYMPKEYQREDREAEGKAWLEGWSDENDRVRSGVTVLECMRRLMRELTAEERAELKREL
jgi:hypothetical protein